MSYDHRDKVCIEYPEVFDHDVSWKTDGRGSTLNSQTILGVAQCRPVHAHNDPSGDAWPKAERYVIAFPNDVHHSVYTEEQFLALCKGGIQYVERRKAKAKKIAEWEKQRRKDLIALCQTRAQIPDSIDGDLVLSTMWDTGAHTVAYPHMTGSVFEPGPPKQEDVDALRDALGLPRLEVA